MSGGSSPVLSSGGRLLGRERERGVLDRLLDGVRGGRGGVLVIHGDAGVGKTALLEYAVAAAREFRVARTFGVEAEMELPFAAMQQLCSPFFELMERLPQPQHEALGVALGLSTGPPPNQFLVGLAVLGLLAEAAGEEQPLVCVVDDAQWLDGASARTVAFVARRLLAEQVALVFAAREVGDALSGLPQLHVEPLSRRDARALLESVLPAPLDEQVMERIVAETRGNPLALLELPRGLSPAQLAGGFGMPAAAALSARIEDVYARRASTLPDGARRLLLAAAADPTGDPALVWRAAERLGILESAAQTVESEGLLTLSPQVVFRHPLVRSAVYGAAGLDDRRAVHRALADATDPERDPDRRAWHRAQAASVPDEEVAAELERSAARAQARGGLAAGAAFLERAAALTPESSRRAQRLLAAAAAKRDTGDLEAALGLLAGIEPGVLDELAQARVDLLRAQIALQQRRGAEAGQLLLSAASRLEALAPELARETYLEALGGAMASDVEVVGGAQAVAVAARAAPPTVPARTVDVVLDAFAIRLIDGYAAAAPALGRALELLLATDIASEDVSRWLSVSSGRDSNMVALELWDDQALHVLAARRVQVARETGAFGHLPFALTFLARSHMLAGEFTAAAVLLDEARLVAEATGIQPVVNAPMILAAWRGNEAPAADLIEAGAEEAARQRWASNNYAKAVLYNGLGRHDAAREAAWEAFAPDPIGYGTWLVSELAEAAARTADRVLLEHAVDWLSERTRVITSGWASGMEARARALLSKGEVAESQYRRSIEHLSGTRARLELARTQLLYGEWLRRERRRLDARRQLRKALEAFSSMGAEAFARRAEGELLATGERARKRTVDSRDQLTPQETQIARLAAEGETNREIAARLFISPSTVEYHLRKAFRKLDVKSRVQLGDRLV